MASPQKRYRGVRQRHWGSWISEIRHSLSRTRIWLGMFETAEEAARAYDEAARLIQGPRARTNFPYNPSASKLLSATVTAKLHRCYMASLQMTKNASAQDPSQRPAKKTPDSANDTFLMPNETMSRSPEKRPAVDGPETDDQVQVVNKKVRVETCNQLQTTTTTATITSFMLLPHGNEEHAKTPISSIAFPTLELKKKFVEEDVSTLEERAKTPEIEKCDVLRDEVIGPALEEQAKTPNEDVASKPMEGVSLAKFTLGDERLSSPESSSKKKNNKILAPSQEKWDLRWKKISFLGIEEDDKDEDTSSKKTPRNAIEEEIKTTIQQDLRDKRLEFPLKLTEVPSIAPEQETQDEEIDQLNEDEEKSSQYGVEEMDEDELIHAGETGTVTTNIGAGVESSRRRFSTSVKGKSTTEDSSIPTPLWYEKAKRHFMERFNRPERAPIEAEDLFKFCGEQTIIGDASVPVEVASTLSQILDKQPEMVPRDISSRLRSYIYTRLGSVFLGMDKLTIENVNDEVILAWRDVCIELSTMGCKVDFIATYLGRAAMEAIQTRSKISERAKMKLEIEKLEKDLATMKQAYVMTYGVAPGAEAEVPSLLKGII